MAVFDITNACNLRCIYCCRGEYDRNKIKEPSRQEFLDTIQQFVKNRSTFVVLQGGEPLIRKDIVPILKSVGEFRKTPGSHLFEDLKELLKLRVKPEEFQLKYKKTLIKNGLPVFYVTTNGMIDSEEIKQALIDGGFSVDISLDSVDPQVNRLTRIGIDFEKVVSTIDHFSDKLPVHLSCTVTEYNVDTLTQMLSFAKEHSCLSVKYSPVIMVGSRKENDEKFRDRYFEQLNRILDRFKNYQDDLFLNVKLYPHYLDCKAGREIYQRLSNTTNIVLEMHECAALHMIKEIYVDTNLDVYGCASMKGTKEAVIGNLHDMSLYEIWHSNTRKEMWKNLQKTHDLLCEYGGCVGAAFCQKIREQGMTNER